MNGTPIKVAIAGGGIAGLALAAGLAKKPHIIIATPGRLNWHLENTKGFSLRSLKFLVRNHFYRSPVLEALNLAYYNSFIIRFSMRQTGCLTWISVPS